MSDQPMIPGLEIFQVFNQQRLQLKKERQIMGIPESYLKILEGRVFALEMEVFLLRAQLERGER